MSVFINNNLGYQDARAWYVIPTPTGTINVHTLGVSLLLLPFFCLGYVFAIFSGAELNGISEPFLKMVSIGALFYLALGLYFLKKLLFEFNFKDKVIAITLFLIFFGTNLLNYTVNEPSMSHVYSFSMITAFLYHVKKLSNQFSRKHLFLSSLLLGLIILIRPVNGIIIFIIPFLSDSFSNFRANVNEIIHHKKHLLIAIFIFFSVLFIQSFIWYIQNNHLIQWSYKGNGFYFDNPHTWLMLFGFDSGFFIYTPLCLVVLLGFFPLFKQNKFRCVVLFLFFTFCFYLFSCYWGYTYFDGLGIRTFVDYYALFSILLATLLSYVIDKKIKFAAFGLILFSSVISLIFCYQYQAGILTRAGMNFNKFKYIFLNTDDSYAGILGGCMDMEPYKETPPDKIFTYNCNGIYTFKNNEFGLGCKVDPLKITSNRLYVKVKLKRKEEVLNSSQMALIVVHVQAENGDSKNYQAYKLNDVPADICCNWEYLNYQITIGDKILPNDKLGVYIWNKERQQFLIENFNVEIYNYNFKTF